MRTLNQAELDTVSGGTFRLLSCLLGSIKKPEPAKCAPEPKCDPAPKCPPAPKKRGC